VSARRSRTDRTALEAIRQQALADLADVAVQQRDGELDGPTAARLRDRYQAELDRAEDGLRRLELGPDAQAAGELDTPTATGTTVTPDDDEPYEIDDDEPYEIDEEEPSARRPATRAGASGRAPAPKGPGAAESDPNAERPARSARRSAMYIGAAVVALVIVAVLAKSALRPRAPGGSATGGISSDVAAGSTDTTRDLSTVSNAEMEQVISQNPDVVPMRLALVERYLRAGDVPNALRQSQEAANRATTDADKATALRYLGWANALNGDPTQGETQIMDSLKLEADNPDSLWFLAIVRYRGLGRAADAVGPLQTLLLQQIPDTQRQVVTDKLAEIQAVVADPSAAATTTTGAVGGAP